MPAMHPFFESSRRHFHWGRLVTVLGYWGLSHVVHLNFSANGQASLFFLGSGWALAAVLLGGSAELAPVQDAAHTLKSAARAVGTLRLSEHCQELEQAARGRDAATCHALLGELAEVAEQTQTAIAAHLSALPP